MNKKAWDGVQVFEGPERTNYPFVMNVDTLREGFELEVQVDSSLDPHRICEFMLKALDELVGALEYKPEIPLYQLDIYRRPNDSRSCGVEQYLRRVPTG